MRSSTAVPPTSSRSAVDPDDRQRSTSQRTATVTLIAAALLGITVPVILAATTGGLGIPHNDAWAYSRIAETFGRTGHIELLGWNLSSLIGQFVVLGPLARWIAVQHLYVAALGAVGLAATYHLVVDRLGRRRAALATLLIALWPGFGLLSTSFMEDVPGFAAVMVCLAIGRRALDRGAVGLLILSAAIGFWGFTVREHVIAAPAAVLLVALAQTLRARRTRDALVVCGIGVTVLAACAAFELWRRQLPAADPAVITASKEVVMTAVQGAYGGYFIVALVLSPAVFLVARPLRWGRWQLLGSAAAALIAAGALHRSGVHKFFVGNYLTTTVPYRQAGNGAPADLIPAPLWWLLVAIACVSGVLMAGILVRQVFRIGPLLGTFGAFLIIENVAISFTPQPMFDRYWLLLAPAVATAVLSERASTVPSAEKPSVGPGRLSRALTAATLACLAAISLVITMSGLAYDQARWEASERLVANGSPATDINGGLEWVGYHSPVGMSPASSWKFPGSRYCWTVSAVQRPDDRVELVWEYRPLLVTGVAHLWVYRDDCRPAGRLVPAG